MKNNLVDTILNEIKGKHTIPNFIVLSFVISLLLIDFFPYFKSFEILNPQFLYLSLINLILGIYYCLNTNLISDSILPILKKSYVLKLYLTFLFFCALSIFFAKNISLVITKFTEIIIIFCLFINLIILLKDKLDLFHKIALIVSVSAFFQSWDELHQFVIIAKHAPVADLLRTMIGNTGNINILAASLTIKVPFILIGILHFKNYKKIFLFFALFSVTAVIFLTAARAAILNLFLIFFVYSIYILKEYAINRSSFFKIIYIIIPVAIAFVFSNSVFKKSNNTSRYVSLENRISQINTKDESSKARLVFWNDALRMNRESHFLGIGLGNYQVECIPYERTTANDSNISLHAHNDFLEILAETGVLNGLVYISLFVLIFIINVKRIVKKTDKKTREIAILVLMLLIVYGIDSFFNFPMYKPTMAIFFSLILALTLINFNENKKEELFYVNKIKVGLLVLVIVSAITTYSAFVIYKASNLEYLITKDDINSNLKGELTGDTVISRMPFYPNVFSSSESFYEYAGIYYIREKKYEKALSCFSKASKINPYLGRIDFYKQVISMQKGDIDSAYFYSKKAFYLRPRNLYFFKSSLQFASQKKDTNEIINQHKLFVKYRNIPDAWNSSVEALRSSGINHKSLLSFIDNGLKENPKDSVLAEKKYKLILSDYLARTQNFESKTKLSEIIEKINSKDPYVLQNLGFYYFNLGQNIKAIKYFSDALKKSQLTDGKTEFYLGYCYLKVNDQQNACKYFNLSKEKKFIKGDLKIFENCR